MIPRASSALALALSMAIAGGLWAADRARAENYPSRPITLVVPFGSGGGIDVVARMIAEKLADRLHQPVVVENRTGGGGIVGTAFVAHAQPDGYKLLFMEMSSALAKWLHKDVPFDLAKDFTPVAMVATNYLGLFAGTSLPANDIAQLVAFSKANPTALSVGIPGVGTPHHLAALMLNRGFNIQIAHVAYRGTPPSVTDLIGGRVPLVWAVPVNVMPFVAQGKAKLLAVSSAQRLTAFPDVPTLAEQGLPGFSVTLWLGIAGPAGMSPEVVSRLSKAIREVAELPEVRARLSAIGYTLDYRSGDALREQMLGDQRKYGEIIRDAGIQPK